MKKTILGFSGCIIHSFVSLVAPTKLLKHNNSLFNQLKIKRVQYPKIIKSNLLLLALISLTACSYRIPLDNKYQQNIKYTKALLVTKQDNLTVEEINPSYTPNTGVVGAVTSSIMANYVNSSNHKMAQPLLDKLKDFQFNESLRVTLNHELESVKWLHFQNFVNRHDYTGLHQDAVLKTVRDGDTFIYLDLSYELSPLSNQMRIKVDVEMFQKEAQKSQLIYRNNFKYIEGPGIQKSVQDCIEMWSKNNADKARRTLHTAIDLLTKSIVDDISDSRVLPATDKPTNMWLMDGRAAYLENIVGDQYILRQKDGTIIIVNKPLVSVKHNWKE